MNCCIISHKVWDSGGPRLPSVERTAKHARVQLPFHVLGAGTLCFLFILLSSTHARPTSPDFPTPSIKSVTCHCVHSAIDASLPRISQNPCVLQLRPMMSQHYANILSLFISWKTFQSLNNTECFCDSFN
jgi:hypothetical protein